MYFPQITVYYFLWLMVFSSPHFPSLFRAALLSAQCCRTNYRIRSCEIVSSLVLHHCFHLPVFSSFEHECILQHLQEYGLICACVRACVYAWLCSIPVSWFIFSALSPMSQYSENAFWCSAAQKIERSNNFVEGHVVIKPKKNAVAKKVVSTLALGNCVLEKKLSACSQPSLQRWWLLYKAIY